MEPAVHDPIVKVDLTDSLALADRDENARHFEQVYRDAAGEMEKVQWAHGCACPALLDWLNEEAPGLVRPGASVCVVGCGLGDDAIEIAARGYEVTGFDVSHTAVEWARRRFPSLAERFQVADLLALPDRLRRRFDVVVDVYTLQSLPPPLREDAAAGLCAVARPRGLIVTICRGRHEHEQLPEERPYPLTQPELLGLMEAQGWSPVRGIDEFYDSEAPPKLRLRGTFRR